MSILRIIDNLLKNNMYQGSPYNIHLGIGIVTRREICKGIFPTHKPNSPHSPLSLYSLSLGHFGTQIYLSYVTCGCR